MSQTQWIVLLLKFGCISGLVSITGWIAVYTFYARWWKNQIGRTLVVKSLLLACLLTPTTLSLFFHFSRLTSQVAGWVDAVLICLITPVMCWRSVVWVKVHNHSHRGEPLP